MLKKELAQKLKDNGFSQVLPKPDFLEIHDALVIHEIYKKYPQEFEPYRPTLEELINACGDKINRLWRVDKSFDNGKTIWCATGINDFNDGMGKTPEEAVANLWLYLKK